MLQFVRFWSPLAERRAPAQSVETREDKQAIQVYNWAGIVATGLLLLSLHWKSWSANSGIRLGNDTLGNGLLHTRSCC